VCSLTRTDTVKEHEKRKASSVESSSDEFDDEGTSDDGLYESCPKIPWTHVATTLSWEDTDVVIRDLSSKHPLNWYNLRERHGFRTKSGVCYRFQ
jgi:hypothetical protein